MALTRHFEEAKLFQASFWLGEKRKREVENDGMRLRREWTFSVNKLSMKLR